MTLVVEAADGHGNRVQLALELDRRTAAAIEPRACTGATVRERRVVETRLDGRPSKSVVYRVEILEGPFRDRLVWVAGYQMFHFRAPDRARSVLERR